MNMIFAALVASTLAMVASTSLAATKFIPLGHSQLEQTAELPKFGSVQSDFNLQTDIYETRNYMRDKDLRDLDQLLRQDRNQFDSDPSKRFIDY